jgi:lysylphosphatidylglycerol synthetase-like protein (DUF2156 family)
MLPRMASTFSSRDSRKLAMTKIERRGKWLFLLIATLVVVDKLAGIGLALSHGLNDVRWLRSVLFPLCFVLGFIPLYAGDEFLRKFMGWAFLANGAFVVVTAVRVYLEASERLQGSDMEALLEVFGSIAAISLLWALLYLITGAALLWLPSIRAYLAYQRQRSA